MREKQTEPDLRYLIIQAVVTILVVAALLTALRLSGIIAVEDAPLTQVEAVTEQTTASK